MSQADHSDHHEIEIKLAVEDHAAVAAAVVEAGGQFVGSFEQTDQFYDTPDWTLRDAGCGLRIRRLRRLDESDGGQGEVDLRPEVTFKGRRRTDTRAKVRPEYQTRLDDAEALEKVFAACGMEPTVVVRKKRTSYRLGGCMVELDELAGIGRFVEIEGPDEREVFELARRLGLGGEPVSESYLAMVLRAGER